MEYRKNEIRAGAFILISFLLAVAILFTVSDLQGMFKKRREYRVLFSHNEGLEKNANVRMSGIRIGRVSGMRIVPELGGKVELTLSVFDDALIKEDAKVSIKTLGLMGKKYVDISGGSPQARVLGAGAVLTGEDALKLEDLTRIAMDVVGKLQGVAQNIDRIIRNVDRAVGDPALAKSLKATVKNLEETSENIKTMTASKDEVARTLKDLPQLLKKIDDSAENLKTITEKTDKLVTENRKNIDEMVEQFRDMGKNLNEASDEIKKAPWKLLRKP